MAWILQAPASDSGKLVSHITTECVAAVGGGAAFAFASAAGIKLLCSYSRFEDFLASANFMLVVGLDAITDSSALEELQSLQLKHPKLDVRLFLHDYPATCFHPKTVWLRTGKGGVTITGSGNLTIGGLRENWEALSVERLTGPQVDEVEASWKAWLRGHDRLLRDPSDRDVIERAARNKVRYARVRRALRISEAAGDAAGAELGEAETDVALSPVLIAEVPRSGNRWSQVNFDVGTYQQFFGVTLGEAKDVQFHQARPDGTLGPPEHPPAVAVKSGNYRFEVEAAHGLPYPAKGHPIVVFVKITASLFNYTLLMPGESDHTLVQRYIDHHYAASSRKRRIRITLGDLQEFWPTSPLLS